MMSLVNPHVFAQMMLQQNLIMQYKLSSPPSVGSNSARFSPISTNSSSSFQSPNKFASIDQDEPLNLCKKDNINDCNNATTKLNAAPFPSQFNLFNAALFNPNFASFLQAQQQQVHNQSSPSSHLHNHNQQQFNDDTCCNPQNRYKRHISSQNQRKTRQFKCNQCQEVFSCLATLTEHTHSIHGGYKCHICTTPFTQRSNLQRHALRHVGFRPYTCAVCLREYYRKDHLIRHISVNHPKVSQPKDQIIQRLSSSESLSYIEQTVTDESIKSEAVDTQQPLPQLPFDNDHSSETLSDAESTQNLSQNIFLNKEFESTEVDIVN